MPSMVKPLRPFQVSSRGIGPVSRSLLWAARPAFERALRFNALNQIYADIQRQVDDDRHFADKALAALGIRYRAGQRQLERIPAEGPLIVVANHPFGGIEGMILASLLRRARPDVKILANFLLAAIPDLRQTFFFVDPFDRPGSRQRNLTATREAIRWVRDGHVLGVFPAGEVSHLHVSRRSVADPPWNPSIARIIQRNGATVVPIFFDGRNSAIFQLMGMIHPRLRTAMLPREMLKRRNRTVTFRIGHAIEARRLDRYEDPNQLTEYLRGRTYLLRPRDEVTQRLSRWRRRDAERRMPPVAPPEPVELVAAEIEALPAEQHLLDSGEMDVFFARAAQIPTGLREIGRLRELCFRQVSEGTGRPCDLDRFDEHYVHLVAWNRAKQEIVGAYRLGATDEILPRFGKHGLYTSTLFHYRTGLLRQIDPALELGRSFIRPEYQRSYAPLMLLWKGIGQYLGRYPRYRTLFGPVSISASYTSMSKMLLQAFLQVNRFRPQLARMLKAKNPPRTRRPLLSNISEFSTVVQDLDEVNDLVSELEADGKPMPVLLRQYLKLNGVLLGFNVDPEFGDVLDGLILVDVAKIDPQIRGRYMGKDAMGKFIEYHGLDE